MTAEMLSLFFILVLKILFFLMEILLKNHNISLFGVDYN
ncbi:hypothetical protein M2373_001128 [Chryseobacterium sp. JUb7]|nr:hypothetical protein [Chryseobacterium sp. JUb7]